LSDDTGKCDAGDALEGVGRNLKEPLTNEKGEVRFVTVNSDKVPCYWTLDALDPRLQTPYWIVEVPKQIIRDHSDIFNENSLALLARLFRLSNPKDAQGIVMTSRPRTMQLSGVEGTTKP